MGSDILCIGTTPAVQRVMVFPRLIVGEVNRAIRTVDGAAGKSINVAKVLHALGDQPVAVGFVGGERGEALLRLLKARGLDLDFVTVAAPTRQCVTLLDECTGTVTELVEESQPVEPDAFEQLLMIVERRVAGCLAMVMSGTVASGGPPDLYACCVRLARKAGVLAVLDASGAPLAGALAAEPDLVKPNRAELEATVGRSLPDEGEVCSAMRELIDRGSRRVIVTAGSRPTLAFDGQRFWRVSVPQVKALNPIGSGDAFTAALVSRLVHGDDLGEACRWASAAGAANALALLAGEVERVDVERLAREVTVERVGAPAQAADPKSGTAHLAGSHSASGNSPITGTDPL